MNPFKVGDVVLRKSPFFRRDTEYITNIKDEQINTDQDFTGISWSHWPFWTSWREFELVTSIFREEENEFHSN